MLVFSSLPFSFLFITHHLYLAEIEIHLYIPPYYSFVLLMYCLIIIIFNFETYVIISKFDFRHSEKELNHSIEAINYLFFFVHVSYFLFYLDYVRSAP